MPAPPRIAVVDYGAGNLRSVAKALVRSGLEVEVTGDPAAVERADGVVLPGVGAFADGMASLRAKSLDVALCTAIDAGTPYLGICLGLQMLFEESDEHGPTPGLGVLPGRVERFPAQEGLRVPHIGWNTVHFGDSHPMLEGTPIEERYYFVHSYRAVPARQRDVIGRVDYGGPFAAAVANDRVFAVQFHPEKSQSAGKRLLDAYASWVALCR